MSNKVWFYNTPPTITYWHCFSDCGYLWHAHYQYKQKRQLHSSMMT